MSHLCNCGIQTSLPSCLSFYRAAPLVLLTSSIMINPTRFKRPTLMKFLRRRGTDIIDQHWQRFSNENISFYWWRDLRRNEQLVNFFIPLSLPVCSKCTSELSHRRRAAKMGSSKNPPSPVATTGWEPGGDISTIRGSCERIAGL